MSEIVLKFPFILQIVDFIANFHLFKLDVDTNKLIVRGWFTEEEKESACYVFKARLLEQTTKN